MKRPEEGQGHGRLRSWEVAPSYEDSPRDEAAGTSTCTLAASVRRYRWQSAWDVHAQPPTPPPPAPLAAAQALSAQPGWLVAAGRAPASRHHQNLIDSYFDVKKVKGCVSSQQFKGQDVKIAKREAHKQDAQNNGRNLAGVKALRHHDEGTRLRQVRRG